MNIVITGGGTGGHLYPGLELAKFYENLGHKVFYIASKNGIDKDIIQNEKGLENINIEYWNLRGLQRKITITNVIENFKTVFKLFYLKSYSKKFLKKNKIQLAIGVGGYISYPIIKEASKNKIYTIIHEQNSYPGLVNKKLANVVNKVAITYESSRKYFEGNGKKIVNTSNPRVDLTLKYKDKDFTQELGLNPDKKKILFLGGSLGAATINNLFYSLISNGQSEDYQFILISGLKNNDLPQAIDLEDNIILENTSELLKYIASVDLVISRAGATSLMEIIYMEKKSIIIPSPNVVANHQYINALEFLKKDLIRLITEKELEQINFINIINEEINNPKMINNLVKYNKIYSLTYFGHVIEEINDIR